MKRIVQLFLVFFSILNNVSCSQIMYEQSSQEPRSDIAYPIGDDQGMLRIEYDNLEPPVNAPEPSEGLASISGILYTPYNSLVLKNMDFYLSPALGENHDQVPEFLITGGLTSRGDILGKTDESGNFYINNIPPGNYYFVISMPNTIYVAVNSIDDFSPRLLSFEADTSYLLGVVVSPLN